MKAKKNKINQARLIKVSMIFFVPFLFLYWLFRNRPFLLNNSI